MGLACPPFYGKSKFYFNKKNKALENIAKFEAKINKEKAIIDICDKELAKNETK